MIYDERPLFHPPPAANRAHQMWTQCDGCGRWRAAPAWKLAQGKRPFCSNACLNRYRTGDRNPRWLGGVSSDNMRYRRRQRERHPDKERARRMVRDAVRAGRLIRQPCSACGSAPAHAHHRDYARPLEVEWLCRWHHDALHHGNSLGTSPDSRSA